MASSLHLTSWLQQLIHYRSISTLYIFILTVHSTYVKLHAPYSHVLHQTVVSEYVNLSTITSPLHRNILLAYLPLRTEVTYKTTMLCVTLLNL